MILGYVLADSGGTAIIIREFVPIFTKEGRDFFAQISSVMYSFVEGLIHSELKHIETEDIHLYFARRGDFILVLFSDVEDDRLATLAENVAKVISDLGYDAFTIQLDDEVRNEVIGVIEKNIITIPPSIHFIRKIMTMIGTILDEKKKTKLNITQSVPRKISISEFLKKRRYVKMASTDQEALAKIILDGGFEDAIRVANQLFEGKLRDHALMAFSKAAILLQMVERHPDAISLEEVLNYASTISHPVLRELLELELKSFENIRAGVERRLHFRKRKRMFLARILTESKDSLFYTLLSFPPADVETAKTIKTRLGEDYQLFSAYCDDFVYYHRVLLTKEPSQDVWLYTMGEIHKKITDLLSKNAAAALIYLRSYLTTVLASIIQHELKAEEALNIMEAFIRNWPSWEKKLNKVKDLWIDVRAAIYAYHLEILKWSILLRIDEVKQKNVIREIEKKAIEYLNWILNMIRGKRAYQVTLYMYASMILSIVSEILAISGKYSDEILDIINLLLNDDLVVLWSERPSEFAMIHASLLTTVANLARFVKIDSVRRRVLGDVAKELLKLSEAFEKLPMLYWRMVFDSIRFLTMAEQRDIELAKKIKEAIRDYAPPYIRKLLDKTVSD